MKSVAEIIEALGGHRRVAAALQVPSGTVSAWKSRGSIPARVWPELIKHAQRDRVQGVTLEALAALQAGPRARNAQPRKDHASEKRRVRIHLDERLLAEAAELGIDVQALTDEALRRAVKREKDRRWQAEHADVIAWYNDHIERDGIFGEEWRTF